MSTKTPTDLKVLTVKDLLVLARKWDVVGAHDMRKEELVAAIANKIRNAERRKAAEAKRNATSGDPAVVSTLLDEATASNKVNETPVAATSVQQRETVTAKTLAAKTAAAKASLIPQPVRTPPPTPAKPVEVEETYSSNGTTPLPPEELRKLREERALENDISITIHGKPPAQQDKLVLIVRDQYWVQAHWEITPRSVERAKMAMGPHWHGAVPVLRLFRYIAEGHSSPRRELERNIRIHGGVSNWYIDVKSPPSRFQVEVGYLSRSFTGNFFVITSSNVVETPQMPVIDHIDSLDGNWASLARSYDHITRTGGASSGSVRDLTTAFELSTKAPAANQTNKTASGENGKKKSAAGSEPFSLQLDLELVLTGKTAPAGHVIFRDEVLRLQKDGAFTARLPFPEARSVLVLKAKSPDGTTERNVTLAVERHTTIDGANS
ncbi:MAG: DUF4912 domain-containing protein [Thermoguttaceae bacterium]